MLSAAEFGHFKELVATDVPTLSSDSATCRKTPAICPGGTEPSSDLESPTGEVIHAALSQHQQPSVSELVAELEDTGKPAGLMFDCMLDDISDVSPLSAAWDPLPPHAVCTASKNASAPAESIEMGPISAQRKITSFYKTRAVRKPAVEKQASLWEPSPASELRSSPLYHPLQVSTEAARVFADTPPKIKEPKPISFHNSYGAYEASCTAVNPQSSSDRDEYAVLETEGKALRIQVDSEIVSTCESPGLGQENNAWPLFNAAQLPTFPRPEAVPLPPSPAYCETEPESPLIGSLFDLPRSDTWTPLPSLPDIPTIVGHWVDEVEGSLRTACKLYGEPSALEDSNIGLAVLLDLDDDGRDDTASSSDDYCTDAPSQDQMSSVCEIEKPATEGIYHPYGSSNIDPDDDMNASVLVNWEDDWEDDDWAVLTPSLSKQSSNSGVDEFLIFERDYEKLALEDAGPDDLTLDLADALRIPLPSSPPTGHLIEEDTRLAQRQIMSELDEHFIQLANMNWGADGDDFAVLPFIRSSRFTCEPEEPFRVFPLIDGEAVGAEGFFL